MKNLIIFLIFSLLFFSCASDDIGVENARALIRRLEKISHGKYTLDLSSLCDRFYYPKTRQNFDYYIELPKLPGGFILQYDSFVEYKYLPQLRHVMVDFSSLVYSYHIFVKELYVYENSMVVVKPKDGEYFLKCVFLPSSTFEVEKIDFPESDFLEKYTFYEFKDRYLFDYNTHGIWHLVSVSKNPRLSKYIFRAIIAAGIVYLNSDPYLVGETIYGPFSFSLNSGELIIYNNRNDFDDFMNASEIDREILPFGYHGHLKKNLEGKEGKKLFTVEYGTR